MKNCPHCVSIKKYLKELNISYVEIDWEASEQNAKLAKQYGIIFAPTMVVVSGDQHQVFARPENIIKFIEA